MRAGAKPTLEHLCRLLLAADQHAVPALRDPCLAAIAHRFDDLATGAGSRPAASLSCSLITGQGNPSNHSSLFAVHGLNASAH